ncbi:MAG: HAD family hydrolase [Promethearchaeota archaeon]
MKKQSMPIKGILFDWGGTLADWTFPGTVEDFLVEWRAQLRKMLLQHGYNVDSKELESVGLRISHANKILQEQALVEITQLFLNQCVLHGVGIFDGKIVEEADAAMTNLALKYTHLTPDAMETIPILKSKGIHLGILSNASNPLMIRHVVDEAKLTSYFKAIIISADLGLRKPFTSLFSFALRKLGTSALETIMVGNDLCADIQGAEKAGLRTAFITRMPKNVSCQETITPTYTISKISDLLSIINKTT